MRLVLATNIASHYQISLCRAFAQQLGEEFRLIVWQPSDKERLELGWSSQFDDSWIVRAWASDTEYKTAQALLSSADVVIWGYASAEIISARLKKRKLTFRYTERLFKQGYTRLLDPRLLRSIAANYLSFRASSHHLLAVGPYCAKDYRLLKAFPGRMWQWGYFPDIPLTTKPKLQNAVPIVLWAGRMLHWKRVHLLLSAAAWARDHGAFPFKIQIIGLGPEEAKLRLLVDHFGLQETCDIGGPQSPEEIAASMENADIYVFPSTRQEGWGVVVNEAMGHGCCMIASSAAGSVPWLIQDGVNGYTFQGSDPKAVGEKLLVCINNPEERQTLGSAAHLSVLRNWSPDVAAKRFLALVDALDSNANPYQFNQGPCSPALDR